jgi:hypothetical protein
LFGYGGKEVGRKVIEFASCIAAANSLRRWSLTLGGWVSATLLIGAARALPEGAPALTYVFVCPDKNEYVVRAEAAEAWVFRHQ